MISFATQTVTVIRAVWVSERGDEIPDWDNATEHDITGCRFQPGATTEVHDNRDALVSSPALFAPVDADLNARDRVRFGGDVYDVDGEIRRWLSPTGALAHAEATLRKVDG